MPKLGLAKTAFEPMPEPKLPKSVAWPWDLALEVSFELWPQQLMQKMLLRLELELVFLRFGF
jgi:hypothetical protein